MPNRFVIFPVGKQTEAEAYKAWGDAQNEAFAVSLGIAPGNNTILGNLNVDAFGQWVTTYFGPPYTFGIPGGDVIEPEDGPAMRADGVLADDWTRPEAPGGF